MRQNIIAILQSQTQGQLKGLKRYINPMLKLIMCVLMEDNTKPNQKELYHNKGLCIRII